MDSTVIAIDGTAASGKSTVARAIAQHFGFVYVNTGAMYRAVTWKAIASGLQTASPEAIAARFSQWNFRCWIEDSICHVEIGGEDPESHARETEVNAFVSVIAAIPEVRAHLVSQQQALAEKASLVMEGRDIGTVVFPRTPYKFFIDADPAVRARRRLAQGETDKINQRDQQDSARTTAPLKPAGDAIHIDSGVLTVEETIAAILKQLEAQGLKTSLPH
jgi:cytidylate kinase